MSTVHRDLSVTCSGCDETFANIETFKRHRRTGRCGKGTIMRKVIGWALLLGPCAIALASFGALTYATEGWHGVAVVAMTGLLVGASMMGVFAVMDAGWRMIEAEKEGEE